jgi:hypothetical protein
MKYVPIDGPSRAEPADALTSADTQRITHTFLAVAMGDPTGIGQNEPDARWPTLEDYGRRYEDLNTKLGRTFSLAEFRGESSDDVSVLRYRLAKIAIAAEDICRVIVIFGADGVTDDRMANAVLELRNACAEIGDSFVDADPALVRLLNFLSS